MDLEEIVAGFREVATASISDAVDKVAGHKGYLDHSIKSRINEKRIAGPAVTMLEVRTDQFQPPQHALDVIDERLRIPARSIRPVDATAAGDTFDGAFLAELVAGRDRFAAARYANTVAALSTQGYGAVAPIPRREAAEAFLAKEDA